ncbi:hypothetical protein K435DRAFT_720412 [Dendrothele bispora CBS 962.96]|uniref:MYND-type domain-containing protein n=1 Tax=Dendrothele bispora (strain CBS 962.96) TaxID=1314807 RepID=A0A4S8M8T9_DENBC|nr:hypothetical protein K435DRAFT_720412 [Dendrothele bispora CBS 962.96]
MGLGDMITIGDFSFCEDHGSEHCSKCFCDYRMVNNIQIEDILQRNFPQKTEEDLLERPPITTAFALFSKTNRKDEEGDPICECKLHRNVDCEQGCLDWGKIVVTRMKNLAKSKNPDAIELDRESKLGMLASMGAEISPKTRLSDSVIDKRLQTAINLIQNLSSLIPEAPFDPVQLGLQKWTSAPTVSGKVYDAVRRSNLTEKLAMMERGDDAFPLYQNAFMDVRQTLMTLASNWDKGKGFGVLQDQADEYVVAFRIIDIYRLKTNPNVPVFFIIYSNISRATPCMDTLSWISDMMRVDAQSSSSEQRGFPRITATQQEQMLFLSILDRNAQRLAPSYKPKRRPTEKQGVFRVSFLFPIEPLGYEDLGRLTKHEGCAICGKVKTSKCSGCMAVEYCGAECQRLHWNEHKPLCKTLKGATFTPVKLSPEPEELRIAETMGMSHKKEVQSAILLNWVDTTEDTWARLAQNKSNLAKSSKDKKSSYEIHGLVPFLIKIQRNRLRPLGEMYVSDRTKSIESFLVRGGEGCWTAEIYDKLQRDRAETGRSDPDEDNVMKAVRGLEEWVDKEGWEKASEEFVKENSQRVGIGGVGIDGKKDKIYRWAKWVPQQGQTDEFDEGERRMVLSVCWDRKQNRDPVW